MQQEADRLAAMQRALSQNSNHNRPKSPFTVKKTVFAQFKQDTEDLTDKCFEFDWQCSKIDKLIKAVVEKEKVYKYLKKKYWIM